MNGWFHYAFYDALPPIFAFTVSIFLQKLDTHVQTGWCRKAEQSLLTPSDSAFLYLKNSSFLDFNYNEILSLWASQDMFTFPLFLF